MTSSPRSTDPHGEAYRRRLEEITAPRSIAPVLKRFRGLIARHFLAAGLIVFAITLAASSLIWGLAASLEAAQSLFPAQRRW